MLSLGHRSSVAGGRGYFLKVRVNVISRSYKGQGHLLLEVVVITSKLMLSQGSVIDSKVISR